MGGVFNTVNTSLYHYAGNNPVKYTDPDGKETVGFNYNNYFQGILYGGLNAIAASFQNFFGEVGNFISNIFKGKGTVEIYYGVSVSFENFEYAATMYVDTDTLNVSFEFSDPTEELSNALQSSLGLPVTINANGFNTDIPLGEYYAVGISVPISCSKNEKKASLSLGLKGSLNSPMADKASGSASAGCRITASIQDGPCGTIKNRKSDSLNQKVHAYLYYKSIDFFAENIE